MRVDLHLHSWVSDGDVAPAEVVRRAVDARLDVISLTDHDTAAGCAEALAEAVTRPIVVVPGIEISTRWGDQELHILGYWIDPSAASILAHQERAMARRAIRMAAMVERLQGMGIGISYADVEAAAGSSTRTLGRPHLARALHARGVTRYYSEAFLRFIGNGGPAFVAEGFPLPEVAIEAIHAAGGVAVLAHPPLPWIPEGLPVLVSQGLDGVECYRPGLEAGDLNMLEMVTRESGLFPTGGSDWHGPHRSNLGEFAVHGLRLREVLARGGIQI
jgi:predicted metal-dependent phosphoesterase TrpH